MKTWWRVVQVLFAVTGGFVVYADWTDDIGAETLAYFIAALALMIMAYRFLVGVMDGRAENEGAVQRGVFLFVAAAVLALVIAGIGVCRPT